MATKKSKEIMKMSRQEREAKLKELKMELVKSSVNSSRSKNSRTGEIKKIIAMILTLNR
ncbi:MAG: 50S ribosomal protein L29 [Nanoarchaeota archaeon]